MSHTPFALDSSFDSLSDEDLAGVAGGGKISGFKKVILTLVTISSLATHRDGPEFEPSFSNARPPFKIGRRR